MSCCGHGRRFWEGPQRVVRCCFVSAEMIFIRFVHVFRRAEAKHQTSTTSCRPNPHPYPEQAVRHSDYMYETHTYLSHLRHPLLFLQTQAKHRHTRGAKTTAPSQQKGQAPWRTGKKTKKQWSGPREVERGVSGHGIKIDGTP